MRTPAALVFLLAGVLLTPVSTQAQSASAGRQLIAPAATYAELTSELATLRLEQADLLARLQRSIGGVEQGSFGMSRARVPPSRAPPASPHPLDHGRNAGWP